MLHGLLEFGSSPPPRLFLHKNSFLMMRLLNKSQGPSQVHGHNAWLMHEVALTSLFGLCMGGQWLGNYFIHRLFFKQCKRERELATNYCGCDKVEFSYSLLGPKIMNSWSPLLH